MKKSLLFLLGVATFSHPMGYLQQAAAGLGLTKKPKPASLPLEITLFKEALGRELAKKNSLGDAPSHLRLEGGASVDGDRAAGHDLQMVIYQVTPSAESAISNYPYALSIEDLPRANRTLDPMQDSISKANEKVTQYAAASGRVSERDLDDYKRQVEKFEKELKVAQYNLESIAEELKYHLPDDIDFDKLVLGTLGRIRRSGAPILMSFE